MLVIYSKKFHLASKSYYASNEFLGNEYKIFFEENLNKKTIKDINQKYKVIMVFQK